MKKICLKIGVILGILALGIILNLECVNATLGQGFDTGVYNQVTSEQATELDDTLYKVVSTIVLILQIAAMAGVVITGVKYMYAGAQDKAKIKQTLIWLIVGAIFVFAAPKVIQFVIDAGNNVL